MPPIGLVLGRLDFSSLFIALDGKSYASLKAAQDAGAATLNYGLFITVVINFLVIAFAVFMIIRAANRLQKPKEEAPAAPPPPSNEEKLLGEIRDLLKQR
jgi:large conductance mechanosensitive channel